MQHSCNLGTALQWSPVYFVAREDEVVKLAKGGHIWALLISERMIVVTVGEQHMDILHGRTPHQFEPLTIPMDA